MHMHARRATCDFSRLAMILKRFIHLTDMASLEFPLCSVVFMIPHKSNLIYATPPKRSTIQSSTINMRFTFMYLTIIMALAANFHLSASPSVLIYSSWNFLRLLTRTIRVVYSPLHQCCDSSEHIIL